MHFVKADKCPYHNRNSICTNTEHDKYLKECRENEEICLQGIEKKITAGLNVCAQRHLGDETDPVIEDIMSKIEILDQLHKEIINREYLCEN